MERYDDPDRVYHYSYNSVNDSLIDKYLLKYWWRLTIRLIPERMSANLVSMIGNIGSWLAFLIVSGILFGPIPVAGREKPWIFALAGIGLIVYHTLDALDGIQARRIGASGPLGEYVDHFFDAFNVFLMPLGLALAFFDIPPPICVIIAYGGAIADWAVLRRVNETGKLYFPKVSHEEAVVLLEFFYIAVAFTGYDMWANPLPGLGISPVYLLLWLFAPVAVVEFMKPIVASRFAWAKDMAAQALSLAPMAAWTLLAEARHGRPALIIGAVLIGCSGARYVGDLLRTRLIGLHARRWYVDMLVWDILLLVPLAFPLSPPWLVLGSGALFLAWVAGSLGLQFKRTLRHIQKTLGTRLLTLPPAPVAAGHSR